MFYPEDCHMDCWLQLFLQFFHLHKYWICSMDKKFWPILNIKLTVKMGQDFFAEFLAWDSSDLNPCNFCLEGLVPVVGTDLGILVKDQRKTKEKYPKYLDFFNFSFQFWTLDIEGNKLTEKWCWHFPLKKVFFGWSRTRTNFS